MPFPQCISNGKYRGVISATRRMTYNYVNIVSLKLCNVNKHVTFKKCHYNTSQVPTSLTIII